MKTKKTIYMYHLDLHILQPLVGALVSQVATTKSPVRWFGQLYQLKLADLGKALSPKGYNQHSRRKREDG